MNKDLAKEMIGHRGVYEIEYKKDEKDETVKILHISNTICSPKLGDSFISAYCSEACKELTFNTKKVLSAREYWIDILSQGATAPKDGTYLVAQGYLGQGIDIDYELLFLTKGDLFESRENSYEKPIAYHFIPPFENADGNWMNKEITIRKWMNEIIPSPKNGIPIIAYREPLKESREYGAVEYCIGNGGNRAYTEVKKNDDVSTFFKESDNARPFGWSERYEGYKILGFTIVCKYDAFICNKNIVKMLIE